MLIPPVFCFEEENKRLWREVGFAANFQLLDTYMEANCIGAFGITVFFAELIFRRVDDT